MTLPLVVVVLLTSSTAPSTAPSRSPSSLSLPAPSAAPSPSSASSPGTALEIQARLRPDAAAPAASSWALEVNLGASGVGGGIALPFGIGLGSVTLLAAPATAGLSVERALGQHWSVGLGLGGGATTAGSSRGASVSVVPAFRWYPSRFLDGGWVALQLPLGRSAWSASGGSGLSSITGTTGGAELLLGWTFRLGSRMLLSLAGGPSAKVTSSSAVMPDAASGGGSSASAASLSLKGQLSVGVAL